MSSSRIFAIARLRHEFDRPNSRLLDPDFREPVKADFVNAEYRIREIHWSEYTSPEGRPIYGKMRHWIVERLSPKHGWMWVTSQILPYFYEPMAFLSYETALTHKNDLENPDSEYFDGFRNYVGQDIYLFEPEYFPKD